MRYFVLAIIVLLFGLGIAALQSIDQTLAFADDALLAVNKWTGSPQILADLRSQVHGYRYDRATPPTAMKLRIVRKGDPPRVLPAPTAVIGSQTYQYGVMPSQLGAPLGGVLGPNDSLPTGTMPPANVVPVKYADDFDEKVPRGQVPHLPSWERKFAGNVNFDVARDWSGYVVWGKPTLDGEFTNRHAGEWSQKISGEATFRSGIMRQFKTAPNTDYTLRVYGHLHILGGGAVHVGVDPTGGTNPSADTVVWFPQYTDLGRWMEMPANGKALAPVITVFLEGYSLFDDNTNSYFDDFELQVYQEA